MSGRVLVFGSINTDITVYVEKLPLPGETVTGGSWDTFPGGKGANQAVAASRTGAPVAVYGCLGDDAFGKDRLAALAATGISTTGVRVRAGARSGVALIIVDAQGENSIAVAPGANMQFEPDGVDIPAVPGGETWVALFQNEIPRETTESIIMKAKEAGCLIMWNIAPTIGRRPEKQVLQAVDYLVCNRNELQALVGGEGDLESQAEVPLGWGVRNMIVTLGVKGSFWRCGREIHRQAAFPVEAVDAVGAGDCYCGVLAAALATGAPVKAALRRASAAAAISTTRRGAQPSMPTGPEIDDFLKKRGE
ncbi:MAG: ribokinase [Spirochaetia bacterium]|jgi:ribokinase